MFKLIIIILVGFQLVFCCCCCMRCALCIYPFHNLRTIFLNSFCSQYCIVLSWPLLNCLCAFFFLIFSVLRLLPSYTMAFQHQCVYSIELLTLWVSNYCVAVNYTFQVVIVFILLFTRSLRILDLRASK